MSYPEGMQADAWVADEERFGVVARRVYARALRRPWTPLVLALAAAAALVAVRAVKPPVYEAAVHFRLDEGAVGDANYAPRPPRDVRDHVAALALSRESLASLLRAHHVSERRLEKDPVTAIDDFRENVDVIVTRNYFLFDREANDEPRTAYVTVTLQGADPEKTRAIMHDLGQRILGAQRAQRVDRLSEAREVFQEELARAQARTRALQAELEQLRRRTDRGEAALGASARIHALEAEALEAIDREVALERRVEGVAFTREAEDRQLSMTLTLFDEGLRTVAAPVGPLALAARGVLAFALALLLAAAVTGAFEDRVYAAEDLALRRVSVLAVIPRFRGDEAGALAPAAAGRRPGAPR
jgi:hypothetical protein